MVFPEHTEKYDAGLEVRRAVMGNEYVDNALSKGCSDFASAAQQMTTELAWGSIWTRPGLDRKQRSLITMTLLATLGKEKELAGHVRGALNNGLTEQEIQECLLQVMVYAGVPTGLEAFRAADPVIQAMKK